MSELSQNPTDKPVPSKARRYWEFVLEGWPVIAAVVGLSWAIALTLGEKFVSDIVDDKITAEINLAEDPTVLQIRTELATINGSLDNLEGNDEEIRNQLGTVITRLDALIQIQLQAGNNQ